MAGAQRISWYRRAGRNHGQAKRDRAGLWSITGQVSGGARGSGRLVSSAKVSSWLTQPAVAENPGRAGVDRAHTCAESDGSPVCLTSEARCTFPADVRMAGEPASCIAAMLATPDGRDNPVGREFAVTSTSSSDKNTAQAADAQLCFTSFSARVVILAH